MFQLAMTYPEEFLQKQTIIFIDEASIAMPSVMWKDAPEFVRLLLAESRKLNIDIIYTTQHPARVYNILRELTETWVKCVNLWNLVILQKEQFISPSVTQIEEISSSTLIYPRRFYGIYNTHYIVGMEKFKISQEEKENASEDKRKLLEFTERLYFHKKNAESSD
ncbi:MAG: zonular occludens toxin domain-containing protein [Patescibacteria group bacterium]|nr:zonular occludens toxin domain-containing protein [Patescibacteria group bacterium]